MDKETWEYIRQILKEFEDEGGFVSFPVEGEFTQNSYTFYTDEIMKIICEEWDPIDASDTDLAVDMLKNIGVNI